MIGSTSEITRCEVCGKADLQPVIDLGLHPMCDDLIPVGDRRECREYPISIVFCAECRTAHQRYQIPKQELFPKTYHYRSRNTADVLDGMKDLVSRCESTIGSLVGKMVLDVGCNDGSLLSFFAAKGARTFGVEPTNAALDASASHTVVNEFFTDAVAERFVSQYGRPDIITFTNVFAHIEDLSALLGALRKAVHRDTVVVIENHYLGAILAKHQFDTFYHEHPRTYSLTSFGHIASALGMKVILAEFPKRYGGNIRVFLSAGKFLSASDIPFQDMCAAESEFGEGLKKLDRLIQIWKVRKHEEIDELTKKYGPLQAKAFPGRAAIPIKILGLTTDHVQAAYEKPLSQKISHYIPGTRIPIQSDDELQLDSKAPLLNMAWHISDEIQGYMRSRGYGGPVIDIISADDFRE